jgi:hypothetical protein
VQRRGIEDWKGSRTVRSVNVEGEMNAIAHADSKVAFLDQFASSRSSPSGLRQE